MARKRSTRDGREVDVHDNDGLRKRCKHPRSQWTRCGCPWHAKFQFEGQEYAFSLHRVARRPRSYAMGKTEAEDLLERLKVQVRDHDFTSPRAQQALRASLAACRSTTSANATSRSTCSSRRAARRPSPR